MNAPSPTPPSCQDLRFNAEAGHRATSPGATLLVTLAVGLALSSVSCRTGKLLECTNCMTSPSDNEQWVQHWCGSHAPYPFTTPCTQTEILFAGFVDSPNAKVTIEAVQRGAPPSNPWAAVAELKSVDSKAGPPYSWSQRFGLGAGFWETTQGPFPATVKNTARVRAQKSPTGALVSLRDDKYLCWSAHPDASFLTNCAAPSSPEVRVVTIQDFGEDCTNLINLIRRMEGVPEIADFKAGRTTADDDAKTVFMTKAHTGGVKQNATSTNPPYESYDEILDIAIYHHMYECEKQLKLTGTQPVDCAQEGWGHYDHIVNKDVKKVACGIYVEPKGVGAQFVAVQNFYLE